MTNIDTVLLNPFYYILNLSLLNYAIWARAIKLLFWILIWLWFGHRSSQSCRYQAFFLNHSHTLFWNTTNHIWPVPGQEVTVVLLFNMCFFYFSNFAYSVTSILLSLYTVYYMHCKTMHASKPLPPLYLWGIGYVHAKLGISNLFHTCNFRIYSVFYR